MTTPRRRGLTELAADTAILPTPVMAENTDRAPISAQPRASSTPESGVISEGFSSTAAPASSAGGTSKPAVMIGKFQG